ncbi:MULTISPECIES: hypothetical protein [Thermoactinomyces]|uniref:Uncharacterized protein n=1 Tax=Thermoactinomyces vulgaris TaxID=2026 RepID=A0ABS0QEP5_THEVU|nr:MULTISPECIES: hypothetical protein [Thermoactinomyces]KFZ41296.1 hypothetical protein JS81_02765 [Thermoactinomyces sp. Gus2-1]KYQ87527.1 hypothetical protein AYX07_02190 [Thermoactinomyces sp. AS95]MBA4551305.1 hypothetical protein [Thermoactinomyces vulgaris]MBA4595484.1 hypothetical protein [Thermoactinomyces vulgaris]MBH8585243.1 hypothetical protein [Thermoactinomyces sp. CICC 10520]
MLSFDENQLKSVLIEEEGIEESKTSFIIENLKKLDDRLQETMDQWMKDRSISNFNVEGVDLKFIMEKGKVNFHNALTIMNAFLYDPNLAETYRKNPYAFSGPMR